MSTPDKAQQPDQDIQEPQDEDLDQVSGGVHPIYWLSTPVVDGDLEGETLGHAPTA